MANTLNYAEAWSPELIEVLVQNTITSPFITQNVKWLDAKTFHFTQMSTTGYKNHSRNGGWNRGNVIQTDVPYTLTHDRDVEFLIDVADVDESAQTASIQSISRVFEQTQVAPEADALFFSKVATKAQSVDGLHSSTATTAYNKGNVYGKIKAMMASGKLRRYRANGSLVCYVSSAIMDLLEQSSDFVRKIEVTQIAEGGAGIETRITDVDGVPFIEVIDDERFYDAFNFAGNDGGFSPADGAHKINVLFASLMTVKAVPKISSIYYFAPGTHTEGDGYLYQNRSLSDVFVFPNGKDGNIDSIFVDVDTVAYEA